MRTTVRLRSDLLKRAKRHAAEENRTLTALIEEGVLLVLSKPRKRTTAERVQLPISTASGGVRPGVDLNNSADLEAILEGS